ncbi:tyrosine protein phosphatase [Natronospirillum operosum]|uniref:Tyrosine protein phosphatase n=1 Tax=Natronospirillum operosum TaxID=2759953 RepID=A0A4Z0WAU7_9GAMM|nr:sulfur transferase domain-containing protein [Natronospirillum operosum]TGG95272.1 tyrosine protein phosphatase [Natronospirillum operosum]
MINPYIRWRKTWPNKMHRPLVRFMAWFELLVIDHGMFRAIYNTPEEISEGVYRSNQPSPWRLKALSEQGFKTIVSLRGRGTDGPWVLEKEACERHGLALHSVRMKSKRPPKKEFVRELHLILATAERPVLLHCKSGADRSGLAAAVHILTSEEGTIEQAKAHLSWKYLHSSSARTGILDAFVREYEAFNAQQPIPFMEWLEHHYEPEALRASFKPSGFASWVIDKVLRRE